MAQQLVPWKKSGLAGPFREMERMRRKIDNLWDSLLESSGEGLREGMSEWVPSIDLSETKDNIVVQAEVPGMDPKEIDISLSQDILTIRGEKKQGKEEKDENYHFVERSYGAFTRSLRLPRGVQSEKVNASYKNGVLKITIPKTEEAKKKQVKIKVE